MSALLHPRRVLIAATASAGLLAGTAAAADASVPGLAPAITRGSHDAGPVAAGSTRRVTLVLASRDPAGLKAFLADPAHASLSPAQYAARFGPRASAVRSVRAWAATAGVRVDSVSANRTLVSLSAPASTLGRALGVSFHRYVGATGSRYVAASTAARLPSAVRGLTQAVVGLSSAGGLHLDHVLKDPGNKPAALDGLGKTYGPRDLATLYGAGSSSDGGGQSVSVIAEGDLSGPKADLSTFEDTYGLPHVTWDQINVGTPSTDTSGSDEWDLDTQYSTGLAPGVGTVHVYVASSLDDAPIMAAINQWVTDKKSTQASFSAGECEVFSKVSGFVDGLDAVLAQAAAQGQTLFTSSGDTGSQCPLPVAGVNGVPVGLPGVSYPASSPDAIGVGGTTVLGSGPTEISWYAGGGGPSLLEPVPAFQQDAGGSFVGARRGVPDVALDADPLSGYEVTVGGTQETVGGTSASAPAWQAIWARAQAAHGGALGFAGPAIYSAPAGVFNDITLGTNTLFPATPGYDYDTGRGTPKIADFVAGVKPPNG